LAERSKIAIVAAMEREVRPLVRDWRVNEKEVNTRRYRFFERDNAVLVCGGIGTDAARRAAEGIISLYGPRMIYSAGFAGALDSKLKIGDVVRPARVVNAGDGSSVAIAAGDGVLVSFASVASAEQKTKLRESFGAVAVDMEAAAVARAAEARGIAFAAVKAISDEADFVFPSMEQFVDAEGRFHDARFALFAAMRPWLWGKVMRLATNSSRAARALRVALEKIVADSSAARNPAPEAVSRR
jgi:adenosylhomocysteine nucleosidase